MVQKSSVQGTKPGHLPRESRSFGKGRVCVQPGCEKMLSQYNRLNKCWGHADMKIPRLRGRKPAPEAF